MRSFGDEQPVDPRDRVFDFAAQRLVGVAKLKQLLALGRGGASGVSGFDPGECALDPVDGAKGTIL
jgi:hypothetical protein